MRYRIPKRALRRVKGYKKIVLSRDKLVKVVTPLLKKAKPFVDSAIKSVSSHPVEAAFGGALGLVAADDIHQHLSNNAQKKKYEEPTRKTTEVIRKHEAEIDSLRDIAKDAQNLKLINEQLCDAIRDQQEKADE